VRIHNLCLTAIATGLYSNVGCDVLLCHDKSCYITASLEIKFMAWLPTHGMVIYDCKSAMHVAKNLQ